MAQTSVAAGAVPVPPAGAADAGAPGLPREPQPGDGRPRLAIVVNNLTPYRIQSHTRVKNEIPAFQLDTYITWDTSRNLWVYKNAPDIGVVTYADAIAESQIGSLDYYGGDWRTGGQIIKHLEQTRPAAVVACGYGYPSLMRVILWCRRTRTPCLLWSDSNVHSDSASGLKRLVKNQVVRWVVRNTQGLLVCGSNGIKYWSRYGAKAEHMFFFPVEPDYDLIGQTTEAQLRDAAERFGLTPGRRRLVVCSRLVPVKAVELAVDAFDAVADRRPNLDLVIVGDGPLRRLISARIPTRLRNRIRLAGFIDRQETVNAIYRQSDVLVHPAVWEPWGVVILEAAAAGLAIITTEVVGAAAELAQDGVNGRLIRPRSRVELAQAILDVTDEGRLDAMKAASLQVSAAFREQRDPVRGLRAALQNVGLLSS